MAEQVSEQMVEAAAQAIYNEYRDRCGMRRVDYFGANQTPAAEQCRRDARAALTAAFAVRENLPTPTPDTDPMPDTYHELWDGRTIRPGGPT